MYMTHVPIKTGSGRNEDKHRISHQSAQGQKIAKIIETSHGEYFLFWKHLILLLEAVRLDLGEKIAEITENGMARDTWRREREGRGRRRWRGRVAGGGEEEEQEEEEGAQKEWLLLLTYTAPVLRDCALCSSRSSAWY